MKDCYPPVIRLSSDPVRKTPTDRLSPPATVPSRTSVPVRPYPVVRDSYPTDRNVYADPKDADVRDVARAFDVVVMADRAVA